MNKEEVLQLWKDVVLEMKAVELEKKTNKYPSIERIELLKKGLTSLNSCDALWCEEEYGKWFHKEIRPFIPKKILDMINKKV